MHKRALKEILIFEGFFSLLFLFFVVGLVLLGDRDMNRSVSDSLKMTAVLGIIFLILMMFFFLQLMRYRSYFRKTSFQVFNTNVRIDYLDFILYLVSLSLFIFIALVIDKLFL